MTVSTDNARNAYQGNGVATSFAFNFSVLDQGDLLVQTFNNVTGAVATLALGTDYSIPAQSIGSTGGGSITTTVPLPSGTTIVLLSNVQYTQPTDFQNQGRFFPETHERALDRLTKLAQQLKLAVSRSLQVLGFETSIGALPPAAIRANKLLSFDSLGNPIASLPISDSAQGVRTDLANPAATFGADLVANAIRSYRLRPYRAKPAKFGYVVGNIFGCETPGQAKHDIDAEPDFDFSYANVQGAGEFWVDPVNGSDANNGNFATPFATLKKGYQQGAAGGTVWLKKGRYTERFDLRGSDNMISATQARATKVKAWDGPGSVVFVAPGQQPSEMTWVIDTGATWKATPAGGQLANAIIFKEQNREVMLKYVTSIALVNASNNAWFQDAATKTIYIRYEAASVQANRVDFEIFYEAPVSLVYGAISYVQDIVFRGCGTIFAIYDPAFPAMRPVIYSRRCVMQYLPDGGIHAEGARVLTQDALVERSLNGDGGNYYDSLNNGTGQAAEVIEVDSIFRETGQIFARNFDGNRNKQGSSGHFNSVILRVNGEYDDNYGQNIADVGLTSATWMVGSVCGNPAGDISGGATLGGFPNLWTEGDAWIDTVQSGGRLVTYGYVINDGAARVYNTLLSGSLGQTLLVDPTSTIVTYNPLTLGETP